MLLPRAGLCILWCWPTRRDVSTGTIAACLLGGSTAKPLLSYCIWGLLHRRNSIPGEVIGSGVEPAVFLKTWVIFIALNCTKPWSSQPEFHHRRSSGTTTYLGATINEWWGRESHYLLRVWLWVGFPFSSGMSSTDMHIWEALTELSGLTWSWERGLGETWRVGGRKWESRYD